MAFNAFHWPFQAPGRADDVRTEATWFDGPRADDARMLEGMDGGVGRILSALDRLQLAQDTLVIFANDNGGERLSRNAPFFHHKAPSARAAFASRVCFAGRDASLRAPYRARPPACSI